MLKPPFWSLLFWFSLVNAHAATSCNPKGTFDLLIPLGLGMLWFFPMTLAIPTQLILVRPETLDSIGI